MTAFLMVVLAVTAACRRTGLNAPLALLVVGLLGSDLRTIDVLAVCAASLVTVVVLRVVWVMGTRLLVHIGPTRQTTPARESVVISWAGTRCWRRCSTPSTSRRPASSTTPKQPARCTAHRCARTCRRPRATTWAGPRCG